MLHYNILHYLLVIIILNRFDRFASSALTPAHSSYLGIDQSGLVDQSNVFVLRMRGGASSNKSSQVSTTSPRGSIIASKPFLQSLLILCCFLYGSSYVSTKYMQERVDAVIVTMLRFFAGLLSFLPVFLRFDGRKEVVLAGIEVGIWYAIGFVAQGISLKTSTAAKASFVCSLGVLVPPLLDTLWPKAEESSKQKNNVLWRFAPATIACIGAGILEFGNAMEPPRLNDFLLFLPPVAYSVAFWRCEKIARKLGSQHQPDVMTFYIMLSSCALSGLYATYCGVLPSTPGAWAALRDIYSSRDMAFFLFYEGCLATALVSALEQHILKFLSAAEVTLIYSLEPVFATVTGVLFIGEEVHPGTFVAGACICTACVLDSIWT